MCSRTRDWEKSSPNLGRNPRRDGSASCQWAPSGQRRDLLSRDDPQASELAIPLRQQTTGSPAMLGRRCELPVRSTVSAGAPARPAWTDKTTFCTRHGWHVCQPRWPPVLAAAQPERDQCNCQLTKPTNSPGATCLGAAHRRPGFSSLLKPSGSGALVQTLRHTWMSSWERCGFMTMRPSPAMDIRNPDLTSSLNTPTRRSSDSSACPLMRRPTSER